MTIERVLALLHPFVICQDNYEMELTPGMCPVYLHSTLGCHAISPFIFPLFYLFICIVFIYYRFFPYFCLRCTYPHHDSYLSLKEHPSFCQQKK